MNEFKITGAELTRGLQSDYITLVTDIQHPDRDTTLKMSIRVKPRTGRRWLKDTFNIEIK